MIAALLARIEALVARNASLVARVAELEAKLGLPPKTPDNSSVPPSKGQKPSERDLCDGRAHSDAAGLRQRGVQRERAERAPWREPGDFLCLARAAGRSGGTKQE
jgi:hypothetical protein